MRRVDFLGASGVGKSTICRQVLAGSTDGWKLAGHVDLKYPRLPFRWRRFRRYARRVAQSVRDQSDDFVPRLLAKIEHACAVEHAPDECCILYDESLSNRAIHTQLRAGPGDRLLRSYLQRMPAPMFVVHLDASIETVMYRIGRRRKTAGLHRGLTESGIEQMERQALELARTGAALLSRRGVPVVTVDAELARNRIVAEVAESVRCAAIGGPRAVPPPSG